MIDQRDIFIGMIFLVGACTFFVGYVWGKWRATPRLEVWPDPDPPQDFDGGYAITHEPRRLTRLTSREITKEY